MKSISLTNFRVFREATTLELAPITILTGRNSSGKSTLIKSIILLSDFINSEGSHLKLNLHGERAGKHKINTFENLKNWFEKDDILIISYEVGEYLFTLTFRLFVEDNESRLESLNIDLEVLEDNLCLDNKFGDYELSVSQNFIDYSTNGSAEKNILKDQAAYISELSYLKDALKKLSSQIKYGNYIGEELNESSSKEEPVMDLIDQRHKLESRISLLKSIINPNFLNF